MIGKKASYFPPSSHCLIIFRLTFSLSEFRYWYCPSRIPTVFNSHDPNILYLATVMLHEDVGIEDSFLSSTRPSTMMNHKNYIFQFRPSMQVANWLPQNPSSMSDLFIIIPFFLFFLKIHIILLSIWLLQESSSIQVWSQ